MSPARATIFGVDLGGTKVRAAAATRGGRIVAETVEPTEHGDAAVYLGQLRRLRDALVAAAGVGPGELLGAGIGLPAAVEPGGVLGSTQNVPGLAGERLEDRLAAALGMPVRLENDANLAALGEGWRGAARGVRDYAVLSVGTGIGAGVVAGGRLVRGAHGWAGELAYLPLGGDPLGPGAREHGAFEMAAAGPALQSRFGAAYGRLEDVTRAAASGDARAVALLDEETRLLALGIAALAAVTDPALVLLSGGVGSVDGLLGPLRRWLAALLPRPPEVRAGALGERAALVGAVRLARGAPQGWRR